MLDAPKTLRAAQIYVYGQWAGNPKGHSYKRGYCAYHVFPPLGMHHQCMRKKGYGPNMLYCRQHTKMLLGV